MSEEKRPTSRAGIIYRVEKEGAGQVALIGPPNSGKSQLVRSLTRAAPEVADYPFTTRLPLPGMLHFEDIQIQLVDLPPVHPEFAESWLYQIIRNADASLLVIDLSDPDLLEDLETTLTEVGNAKVQLTDGPPSALGWVSKRTLLAANKQERPEARDNLEVLRKPDPEDDAPHEQHNARKQRQRQCDVFQDPAFVFACHIVIPGPDWGACFPRK